PPLQIVLFMDDNAPPHGARIVTAGLQEVRVPHVERPTDLNPMEHVWDQQKQRLDDSNPTSKSPGRTHREARKEHETHC
uniref:Tc1-like transposase DDE domain-containing protein n=1 Tax=Oryzias sinensis TaxID=183150 RepID=A0A8C8DT76_9TELE